MPTLRTTTATAPRRRTATRSRTAPMVFLIWRGLAIGSLLVLAVMALASPARSQTPGAGAADLPNGLLFRKVEGGDAFLAPTLATEVRIDVHGTVERVTVRQHFVNPSSAWLEGIYLFPLPERAAVDHLVMQIGERRIVGRIEPREEAQAIYEAAAASGQQASLVSQERPNVFTSAVANIGPGETIVVEIGYQDAVAVDDGRYSLRFPMVAAPRYVPGADGIGMVAAGPAPGLQPDLARVPDAGRIDGPVRDPADTPPGVDHNPLTLAVTLDPGFPLGAVTSLYHPVAVSAGEGGIRRITLAEGNVPADRDFVLEWAPAAEAGPAAAVFAEQRRDAEGRTDTHLLVTLTPPAGTGAPTVRLPRDVIFVIDTSGSMAGPSIAQAKAALSLAIDRLAPGDRFNVIRFSNETEALFPGLRPWTADSLRAAQAAVARLEAEGGTEMRPALRLALGMIGADGDSEAGGRLRQVVFLTDAAVGNEAELFDDIAGRLGDTRLFTIGIGAAPNSYFMRKAAELGRGSYTYIGDITEVGVRMTALLARLDSPVLTDVTVTWPSALAGRIEAFPQPVPDLYRGEPIAFTARLDDVAAADLAGTVEISARTAAGGSWTAELPLAGLPSAPGVAAVWARAKLEAIEDRLWRGADAEGVRAAALRHALAYGLVSRYTSLVAVDETIVRPQDQALRVAEIERNLPEGWVYDEVFGTAGSIDPAALPPPEALMQRIARPAALQGPGQRLPATATAAGLRMTVGSALLLLGLGGLIALRRAGWLPWTAEARRG